MHLPASLVLLNPYIIPVPLLSKSIKPGPFTDVSMVSTLVGSGLGHYVVSEHASVPLQHHLASLYGVYFGWIRFETTELYDCRG